MSVLTLTDTGGRTAAAQAFPLFTPLQIGDIALRHRVVVGAWPLRRALPPRGVPTPSMVAHYAQCATPGGLIVCEPVRVAPGGTPGSTPGLYAAEQVNLWRDVTDGIHARGAYAVAHLCHPGALLTERLATLEAVLEDYRSAAENAGDAGFDAVELDAAPGSVPASLVAGYSSLPGLAEASDGARGLRLLTDVVQALMGVWPAHRVGVWLSGSRAAVPLAERLAALGIGYLHADATEPAALAQLRSAFAGPLVLAVPGRAVPADALARTGGVADALSFGEAFVLEPDLVEVLRHAHPLMPRMGAPRPERRSHPRGAAR